MSNFDYHHWGRRCFFLLDTNDISISKNIFNQLRIITFVPVAKTVITVFNCDTERDIIRIVYKRIIINHKSSYL